MEVQIVFKLQYDKEHDGTLAKFREKYYKLKAHIDRMQANGSLPRGLVRWSVEHKQPQPPPSGPAAVVGFVPRNRLLPAVAHTAGTRLDGQRIDPTRIAM